jgi:hypothetical protein
MVKIWHAHHFKHRGTMGHMAVTLEAAGVQPHHVDIFLL